jgi:hypothetical protein
MAETNVVYAAQRVTVQKDDSQTVDVSETLHRRLFNR